MYIHHLRELLEHNLQKYNTRSFIENDPISIPYRYSKLQDIEISGLFAATFSWGQRKTIIGKSSELMRLMHDAPHEFVINHTEQDLQLLMDFKHRTFNYTDLLYFIHFLKNHYTKHQSLEELFIPGEESENVKRGIENFHTHFIADEFFPPRTGKHIASPAKNSACKRINMFLRWMVRKDESGVDFGIWKRIKPHQLICPFDIHVEKVVRKLGLVTRKQVDWMAAEELTKNLKQLDPDDPVKYDFALFGMGMDGDY